MIDNTILFLTISRLCIGIGGGAYCIALIIGCSRDIWRMRRDKDEAVMRAHEWFIIELRAAIDARLAEIDRL